MRLSRPPTYPVSATTGTLPSDRSYDRAVSTGRRRRHLISKGVQVTELDDPSPVVASLPHGGERVPKWAAKHLRVRPQALFADWFTPDLYDRPRCSW